LFISFVRPKETNQRKFKAADNFGASVFQLAHAIQLARFTRSNSIAYCRPTQQVSKQSLFPKIL
jgi:alpha-D-ribose 1-methylphosphonate 5-phosphate C-P lyase